MTNKELAIRIKAEIDIVEHMFALWQQNRNFIYEIQGSLYQAVQRYGKNLA